MFALAFGSAGFMGAMSAYATAVKPGNVLTIQSPTFDSSGYIMLGSGSYFAMDSNGNGFSQNDTIALSQGTAGLVIGTATPAILATVPIDDEIGLEGINYMLHLQGTATTAVPEASTYGMMFAGLGLVGFMARRRS